MTNLLQEKKKQLSQRF